MSARRLQALAGGIVILVGLGAGMLQPLPPCQHEDSPGPCYWDAGHRGNGEGTSFVNLDRGQR